MSSEQSVVAAIEERVIAAERELRLIRGALAAVTRCTCPVGFGSEPDYRCPKHGNRS